MAKQKKPVHRVEMTEGKRNIIRQLLEEYDIETAEDIQDRFVAFSTVNVNFEYRAPLARETSPTLTEI